MNVIYCAIYASNTVIELNKYYPEIKILHFRQKLNKGWEYLRIEIDRPNPLR